MIANTLFRVIHLDHLVRPSFPVSYFSLSISTYRGENLPITFLFHYLEPLTLDKSLVESYGHHPGLLATI